jgi:hypothetical protein
MTFEPVVKVEVEELTSIGAVYSQKIEGLALPNRFNPFETRLLPSLSPPAQFSPPARNLHAGERPDEISAHVTPAMCHSVVFSEATALRSPSQIFFSVSASMR